MSPEEYVVFKKQFWEWFDNLPKSERIHYKNFNLDLAETKFYYKYYKKDSLENE